jgi:hypothetical protein
MHIICAIVVVDTLIGFGIKDLESKVKDTGMVIGKKSMKMLGILSLIGSLTAAPLMVAFALSGWGEPGTSAYQAYEPLNRLMAFSLLMMAAGWLVLALKTPNGYGLWGAWLALLAALVMVTGNAAEFYLFTDQPYGDYSNLRTISWMAFSLGSLALDIGASIVGVAVWRRRFWPRWGGMLLMLALPIDTLAFLPYRRSLAPLCWRWGPVECW